MAGSVSSSFERCTLSVSSGSISPSGEAEASIAKIDRISSKKILKGILGEYRDYIETRFNVCYKASPGEFDIKDKERDLVQKKEYVDVLNLLKLFDEKSDTHFCYALKIDEIAQGIISMKVDDESEELHISVLLTAPWNLRLSAPNHEARAVSKGVGKQLMNAAYQFAQISGQKKICLRPMGKSFGFYKHIGMDPRGEDMVFDVEPDTIPESLEFSAPKIVD